VTPPPQRAEAPPSKSVSKPFPSSGLSKPDRGQRETDSLLQPATGSERNETQQATIYQRLCHLKTFITPKTISLLAGVGMMLIGTVIFVGFMTGLNSSSSKVRTLEPSEVQDDLWVSTFTGHSSLITAIAFSSNGETLVSASTDKTIKVWDLQLEQSIQTFSEGSGESPAIAISSDGQTLASSSMGNTVKVWNL